MKHRQIMHRPALGLLLAAAALPFTPAFAQNQPAPSDPPPIVDTAPPVTPTPAPQAAPPAPVETAPPPAATIPPPIITPPPVVTTPPIAATPAVRDRTPVRRTVRSTTTRTVARQSAPVRQPAPAPAPTPATAPPLAAQAPVAPAPAPVAAAPVETPAPVAARTNAVPLWAWLLGGIAVLGALLGLVAWRRRSADEEYYLDEPVAYEEPAAYAEPVPVAAAPMTASAPILAEAAAETAAVEELAVAEPDAADVEALAATSAAPDGRPWIEFLMRPVRAGTNAEDAVVEFELTVGNTGDVAAKDVRISTWMFAAGSPQESEMERMLINPPAEAALPKVTINAGDATKVEATMALPKAGLDETVLPVVVADARYRLPDGSEGRTSASFAVGLAEGEDIAPFQVDDRSGLHEDIGSRLHGELQRA
jgi:hypothetical protein